MEFGYDNDFATLFSVFKQKIYHIKKIEIRVFWHSFAVYSKGKIPWIVKNRLMTRKQLSNSTFSREIY